MRIVAAAIEDFYKQLGKKLQGRRSELGLTQEKLGQRLQPELTRASIANIEGGKQRVLAHTFVAIAAALDTSLDDLVMSPVIVADEIEQELTGKIGSEVAAAVISRIAAVSTNGAGHEHSSGAKTRGKTDRRVRGK
jgi:transcriptional regulator with XRE-family HTH domain